MRKSRNSLADSESSGSESEDHPHFPALEEEFSSSQSSSESVKFQGDSSSERHGKGEGGSSDSSRSLNNTSLEHKDDESPEQSRKNTDVNSKVKKPIPKPRKHIPRKDTNSKTAKDDGCVDVLGINVRRTSTLKFKQFLRGPRVRISIFDQNTGQFAKKSKPGQNVVFNKEPDTLDHILPIISTRGAMTGEMSFSWNELIVLNDAVEHLLSVNFIMFFEIIDVVLNPIKHANHKKVHDGWYHACWAFIRLSSQNKEKFGENLNLQLYKYVNLAENKTIFQQWSLPNLKKYPGTLEINYTSILPKCDGIGLLRPFTALESDKQLPMPSSNNNNYSIEKDASEDLAPSSWIKTFEIIRRKSFEPPTKKIFESVTIGSSTVCRFSPDGRCVAYTDNSVKGPAILVKYVRNLHCSLVLKGHTSVIHSLDWYYAGEQNRVLFLISTSEDQSCIVWKVEEDSYMLQHVLPHPCYLYCSIYVQAKSKQKPQIITGGRDCILRVWDNSTANTRILQELHHHNSYIVKLAYSNVLHTFLSADSQGKIIEWGYDSSKKVWKLKREFNVKEAIRQFYLHPLATNAYALIDRAIVKIDLHSGSLQCPLKNFIGTLDVERFTVSESGANIFLTTNTEVICVHQFSEEVLCKIRLTRGPGRANCIDFCIQSNLLAVSMRNSVLGGEFFLFGPEKKVDDVQVEADSRGNVQQFSNSGDGPFLRNSTFNEILNKLEDILRVKGNVPVERKILLKQNSKDEEAYSTTLKGDDTKSDNLTYSISRSGTFTIDKESKQKDRRSEIIGHNKDTFTVSLKSGTDDDDDTDVSMELQSSGRQPTTQRSNRTVIFCKEFESEKKE